MKSLSDDFKLAWRAFASEDALAPEYEHSFHPSRRWRFDVAWPTLKIAVELEGGIFGRGRHTRGSGYSADCDKYNAAQRLGWDVYRYTTLHFNDPSHVIQEILEIIAERISSAS